MLKNGIKYGWLDRAARPGIALCVMLTLAFGIGARHDATGQDGLPESLSGTWTMNTALVDCNSGAVLPVPRNPFSATITFLTNGTLVETSGRVPTRSPGHGVWERNGHNTFAARFAFYRYAADGSFIGTQEVVQNQRLLNRDEFESTAAVKLLDAAGNIVGTGCGRGQAQRFTLDP